MDLFGVPDAGIDLIGLDMSLGDRLYATHSIDLARTQRAPSALSQNAAAGAAQQVSRHIPTICAMPSTRATHPVNEKRTYLVRFLVR
ncbi:hypothetical protein [Bradyrhizobium sp. Gha]|uniref:hypothetical protein n=1 Tax=Bradyrhizobium sp. Gha TaxID=1855318 RepID=UPI0008E39FF8|nr:hypothetical protein [Bradyrhizobium sp. Gha]SFI10157.1 hypothetical protein SAMN05216525_104115 [Bradyrhizobium sp. Gha]